MNLVLNLALIEPFQHAGLAFATSAAALVNALGLWVWLHRRGYYRWSATDWVWLLRLVVGCALWTLALVWADVPSLPWQNWTVGQAMPILLLIIGLAMMAYGVVLRLMGINLLALRHAKFGGQL